MNITKEHLALVQRIAKTMCRKNVYISFDDAVQDGAVGLIEAIEGYDSSLGADFDTYAGIRIRGAIIDGLRRQTSHSRGTIRFKRELAEATQQCERIFCRPCKNREIASFMGLTLTEFEQKRASLTDQVSVDTHESGLDFFLSEELSLFSEPTNIILSEQTKNILAEAILQLDYLEKTIYRLHIEEEWKLHEIGKLMNVSESRVCQIFSSLSLKLESAVEILSNHSLKKLLAE